MCGLPDCGAAPCQATTSWNCLLERCLPEGCRQPCKNRPSNSQRTHREPHDPWEVQVVCGLVQQQQVGLQEQRLGERRADAPAACGASQGCVGRVRWLLVSCAQRSMVWASTPGATACQHGAAHHRTAAAWRARGGWRIDGLVPARTLPDSCPRGASCWAVLSPRPVRMLRAAASASSGSRSASRSNRSMRRS